MIPGHSNLNEAAKQLGVKKGMLLHQLRQVEDDIGAALINLGGAPVITLTSAGECFARAVRPVLTTLERHRNQPAPPAAFEDGSVRWEWQVIAILHVALRDRALRVP